MKLKQRFISMVLAGSMIFGNTMISSANTSLNDIEEHWAESTIKSFVSKGYVNGYADGTFKPNNSITRAEFVSILNSYFGLTKTSGKVFSDTKSHWAKTAIDIAVTNGVCSGVTATSFKPNDPITREQVAVMLSSYKKLNDNHHEELHEFKDMNNISTWAKDSVEGVVERDYMSGYSDKTFKPKNKITRAEAVVTLSRVHKGAVPPVVNTPIPFTTDKALDYFENYFDITLTKNNNGEYTYDGERSYKFNMTNIKEIYNNKEYYIIHAYITSSVADGITLYIGEDKNVYYDSTSFDGPGNLAPKEMFY